MSEPTMHILVGLDFSEASAMALVHARRLAERTGARLHISHIVKDDGVQAPLNLGFNIPDEFPEAKETRVLLEHLRAEMGSGLDVELHVRIGPPIEAMLGLINDLKPDVVVVCSHGKGLVRRTLLGSFSDQLVQRSPVPVLVVPAPGRETKLPVNQQPPPPDDGLPAVGRAVADPEPDAAQATGIAGVGGGSVIIR